MALLLQETTTERTRCPFCAAVLTETVTVRERGQDHLRREVWTVRTVGPTEDAKLETWRSHMESHVEELVANTVPA